ncbi:unnamed protein product [Prorocentrum cordatum]|uniref:Secreted protein n=1 Tax=Prorocentrum cordatum TaxID=2364126 RepID=A0ABN9TB20_9DINO|nr:unnamed protein product [Polarella glacialis]
MTMPRVLLRASALVRATYAKGSPPAATRCSISAIGGVGRTAPSVEERPSRGRLSLFQCPSTKFATSAMFGPNLNTCVRCLRRIVSPIGQSLSADKASVAPRKP